MLKSKTMRKGLLHNLGAGSVVCAALLAGGALASAGCQTWENGHAYSEHEVRFSLHADRTDLRPGETAMITVDSANTLGQDPRVEWTTSGGKLDTEEGNGMARATFSQPGTYLVEAKLFLKNQLVREDSVTINVHQPG